MDAAIDLPHIKSGTLAQLCSQDGKIRFFTPLVGVDENKLIVAHLPSVREMQHKLCHAFISANWYENFLALKPDLILRFVDHGVVYAFRTSVIEVIQTRTRLLLLDYPQEIHSRNVRKEPRYPCTLAANILSGIRQRGQVNDLSYGGCQLRLPGADALHQIRDAKVEDSAIKLEILFPHRDAFRTLEGRVITVLPCENGLRIGMAFKDRPAPVREYLDRLSLR